MLWALRPLWPLRACASRAPRRAALVPSPLSPLAFTRLRLRLLLRLALLLPVALRLCLHLAHVGVPSALLVCRAIEAAQHALQPVLSAPHARRERVLVTALTAVLARQVRCCARWACARRVTRPPSRLPLAALLTTPRRATLAALLTLLTALLALHATLLTLLTALLALHATLLALLTALLALHATLLCAPLTHLLHRRRCPA
eukprot:7385153-Prymnesium_polylepis.1